MHTPPDTNGVMVIDKKQSAILAALIIVVLAGSFVLGYFQGYRHALQSETPTISNAHFNDTIELNAYKQWNANEQEEAPVSPPEPVSQTEVSTEQITAQTEATQKEYTARIIGFNGRSKARALAFIQTWNKKGIPLELKTRQSVDNAGKKRVWYQVTLQPQSDRVTCENMVHLITQQEHLPPISIIEC